MKVVAGIDIGGTKCAVSFAHMKEEEIEFLDKVRMETDTECFDNVMQGVVSIIADKLQENPEWRLMSIGISCGGPLDAEKGLILSPPNLPKWDHADVFTPLKRTFGVPVMIQNDADACALAEWSLGAGRGSRNMIFLTFGTGMGAGLILNNELYSGSCGLAGEVGHIRMEDDGPYGYGKYGSFEGFCSGGGIARLGRMKALEAIRAGNPPLFCQSEDQLDTISGKTIADALHAGDPLAAEIYDIVGKYLGRGLSVLIDILNPQVIVIGSIYGRQKEVLDKEMYRVLELEALAASRGACKIVPASLGEMIGDYAAISVGIKAYRDLYQKGSFQFYDMAETSVLTRLYSGKSPCLNSHRTGLSSVSDAGASPLSSALPM